MNKTIVVCGYGTGISDAVARKFGAQGFSVALVARNHDRLASAAHALEASGVRAAAFPADLGDPAAVKKLVADVRAKLGPITVVHWNAYASGAGDLTTAPAEELHRVFGVSVTGLMVAVQEALPDLRAQKDAAVLVTGGGFALYNPQVDAMAAQYGAMGLAVGKAAQHKLVGVLAEKLGAEGIYVGEVMVLGMVKGTRFDAGNATLEADKIADAFWGLYEKRAPRSVDVR